MFDPACNVLYLNSVETESLTGPQAISKATKCTLALSPRPTATVVHFKVSAQGITLTDSKRRYIEATIAGAHICLSQMMVSQLADIHDYNFKLTIDSQIIAINDLIV